MAITKPRGKCGPQKTAEFTLGRTSEMETRFTIEEQHRNVPECWLQKKNKTVFDIQPQFWAGSLRGRRKVDCSKASCWKRQAIMFRTGCEWDSQEFSYRFGK